MTIALATTALVGATTAGLLAERMRLLSASSAAGDDDDHAASHCARLCEVEARLGDERHATPAELADLIDVVQFNEQGNRGDPSTPGILAAVAAGLRRMTAPLPLAA